jgi:hypothetical protein
VATINVLFPSLIDVAKRTDPDGKIAMLAELLNQTNPILEDCVWAESNGALDHTVTVRTGLPTVYFRMLNQGVPPSKSTTAQVKEALAIMEAYSEVDKDLAMLNGNTNEFRLSEDRAFIEAMNQKQAETCFYGNPSVDPKSYAGLAARYSTKSGAVNGRNVLLAGGAGVDNSSIWLVVWGMNTVFMTYPKGSQAGLLANDLGEDTSIDSQGGRLQVLRSHYQWKAGLVVKDWRYVVRIANISAAALAGGSPPDLIRLMQQAIDLIPSLGMGRASFYCTRTAAGAVRDQAAGKTGNVLTVEQGLTQLGTNIITQRFLGIPLRVTDALTSAEATVA